MAPKGITLLGDVAFLEEVCHFGGGLKVYLAQATLSMTLSQLPDACKIKHSQLQHQVCLHATMLIMG